jgi:hypothetical protein
MGYLLPESFPIILPQLSEKGNRYFTPAPTNAKGAVKKRSESHSRTSQSLVFAGFGRI